MQNIDTVKSKTEQGTEQRELERLTRHKTSSTVCLRLCGDGSSMLFQGDFEL